MQAEKLSRHLVNEVYVHRCKHTCMYVRVYTCACGYTYLEFVFTGNEFLELVSEGLWMMQRRRQLVMMQRRRQLVMVQRRRQLVDDVYVMCMCVFLVRAYSLFAMHKHTHVYPHTHTHIHRKYL